MLLTGFFILLYSLILFNVNNFLVFISKNNDELIVEKIISLFYSSLTSIISIIILTEFYIFNNFNNYGFDFIIGISISYFIWEYKKRKNIYSLLCLLLFISICVENMFLKFHKHYIYLLHLLSFDFGIIFLNISLILSNDFSLINDDLKNKYMKFDDICKKLFMFIYFIVRLIFGPIITIIYLINLENNDLMFMNIIKFLFSLFMISLNIINYYKIKDFYLLLYPLQIDNNKKTMNIEEKISDNIIKYIDDEQYNFSSDEEDVKNKND